MRNKFTKQAQTALTLAKAAAIDFELGYIGTEHLLLGLLSETEGTAGRVLEEFQVDGKKLVELIDKLVNDAYCNDILIQSAAVNAAVNAFNKELLANHIRTCVARDIRDGKDETIDELVATLQKLMK